MRRLALVALVVLAACGTAGTTTTTTRHQTVTDWYAQHDTLLTDLQTDMGSVSDAATAQDFPALSDACHQLSGTVRRAQQVEAVPDPSVDVHWQAALDHFASAATSCHDGADNQDSTEMQQSASEIR
jgi:hypothetical protein